MHEVAIVKFPVLGRTSDKWHRTTDGLLLPVVGVSHGAVPIVAIVPVVVTVRLVRAASTRCAHRPPPIGAPTVSWRGPGPARGSTGNSYWFEATFLCSLDETRGGISMSSFSTSPCCSNKCNRSLRPPWPLAHGVDSILRLLL